MSVPDFRRFYLGGKTKKGDWANSDQGTVRDFILSVLPGNGFELFVISLLSIGLFGSLSDLTLSSPIHPLFIVAYLAQAMSLVTFLLRLPVYIPIQLATIIIQIVISIFQFRIYYHQSPFPEFSIIPFAFSSGLSLFFLCLIWFGRFGLIYLFPSSVSRRMRPQAFPPRQQGRYRILFIEPANAVDEKAFSYRRTFYPAITPYLAALVPPQWDVMILDQVFDEIDYDLDVDVVGIPTMAFQIFAVREIAENFKKRGVTVFLGGPEASRAPEKYDDVSSSVLVGDAVGFLSRMLQDWEKGQLRKRYLNPTPHHLRSMPLPRYDLLPLRRYLNVHNILISTSCPYNCSFCNYNRTREPRLRPAKEVAAAIRATPARLFWLEAPELIVYKDYVKELERELGPLNVRWATFSTVRSVLNDEILKSAYRAGLRQLWLGVESFSAESLRFVNKSMNRPSTYPKAFKQLDKNGISVVCMIIMGLPYDKLSDYDNTLHGLVRGKTAQLGLHVLGCYSGDEVFEKKLLSVGAKPFDVFVQSRYQAKGYQFFKPPGFTDQMMAEKFAQTFKSYYSFKNIINRLAFRSIKNLHNLPIDLFANLAYKFHRSSPGNAPWSLYSLLDSHFYLEPGTTEREIQPNR